MHAHGTQFADVTLLDQIAYITAMRRETPLQADDMTHATFSRQSQQFFRLGKRGRQRPFAVHMLARRDHPPDGLRMLRSRVQHDHQIDVVTVDKCVDRFSHAPDPVFARRGFSGFVPLAVNGLQRVLRQQIEHTQMTVLRPVADADHADAQWHVK